MAFPSLAHRERGPAPTAGFDAVGRGLAGVVHLHPPCQIGGGARMPLRDEGKRSI